MTWTADEWEGFTLCLEEWWKDDLSDAQRTAWKLAIDDVEPVHAVATLKQLLRRGDTWRPSVAEFVTALAPPAPTWEEAWPGIKLAMSSYDPYNAGSSTQKVLGLLRAWGGDVVAGWVASYGVGYLAAEAVDDPDYGGAVVKRLRDNYAEITSQPSGRDRLVSALNGPDRQGQLRRMNPLAALPEATP